MAQLTHALGMDIVNDKVKAPMAQPTMGQKPENQVKVLARVGQMMCPAQLAQVRVKVRDPMKNRVILIVAAVMRVDKGINTAHCPMTVATALEHLVVAMKAYRLAANHKMAPSIKHQKTIRLLVARHQTLRLAIQVRINN